MRVRLFSAKKVKVTKSTRAKAHIRRLPQASFGRLIYKRK